MVHIRRATPADLDGLVELWAALGTEGHRADPRYRMRPGTAAIGRVLIAGWLVSDHHVVVADDSGEVVGFMAMRPADRHPVLDEPLTLRITDAYVAPGYRRCGVGRRLFDAVETAANGRFAAIEVGTLALDDRAVAFWRALGFGDWRVTLQRAVVDVAS